MKKICLGLIPLLVLPFFIHEGYTEPTPIVYRGPDYTKTTYQNGTVFWTSQPQYVFDGSNWVHHIFEDHYND